MLAIKKVRGIWYRILLGKGEGRHLVLQDGDSQFVYRANEIPEWEAKAELFCQLWEVTVPEGWMIVGFGKVGERFLTHKGRVVQNTLYSCPIIKEIERETMKCKHCGAAIYKANATWYHRCSRSSACELSAEPAEEWVTPTDGPSLPEVEVRDRDDMEWETAGLITVLKDGEQYPFYVMLLDGYMEYYAQCRMRRTV